jgi:hypothetical protein
LARNDEIKKQPYQVCFHTFKPVVSSKGLIDKDQLKGQEGRRKRTGFSSFGAPAASQNGGLPGKYSYKRGFSLAEALH